MTVTEQAEKPSVLVVDDEPDMRLLARTSAGARGARRRG